MKIIEYKDTHKQDCMAIFESNTPKYLAVQEKADFERFLDSKAESRPYFVVLIGNTLVGCGGYVIYNNQAGLSWGLVLGSKHNKRIGEALLQYRLNHIHQNKGKIPIKLDTSQHTEGFFKKYGFETIEIIENGYSLGLHKVLMQKMGSE